MGAVIEFPNGHGLVAATPAALVREREASRRIIEVCDRVCAASDAMSRESCGRLRPGAVLGEREASTLWPEFEKATCHGDLQVLQRVCIVCPDYEDCNWGDDEPGCCDRQHNVTRFFDGKTVPAYRERGDA